jgi:amino acid transporter
MLQSLVKRLAYLFVKKDGMMTTSDTSIPMDGSSEREPTDVRPQSAHRLHRNALGLPAILFVCIAAIAPAASMLFNVPVMASQAGAATPLAFLLSMVGILFLGISIVSFASRLSSAGGFATWVRHGLGAHAGFQTGWLLLGAYGLFEAALHATVGSSLDHLLAPLGIHLPLGWMSYALILTLIVGMLSYFDVKASIWIMAPFAVAEVVALCVLNLAITLKGGAGGHDLLHTFTPAGADVSGVAPGGLLGIGLATALGCLAFVGFETGAVYGEEARQPRRAIPVAVFSLLLFLSLLYTWTAYSATIGLGWQQAGNVLGNIAMAPQQYVILADRYVGNWLGLALVLLVISSNAASAFAMHQAMVRYLYAMGRDHLLPARLGYTHPRWKSPVVATSLQSGMTILLILFLGLLIEHSNADGRIHYAIGLPDGTMWQQVNGLVSFQWLVTICTICFLLVYLLTNVAAPIYAIRRKALRLFPHLIAPIVSTLFLLVPLASYVLPPLPGIGEVVTTLGFAPTPFPLNVLPLFVLGWMLLGGVYAVVLQKRHPERLEHMGRVFEEA